MAGVYVALLRGINVGRAKRISMAQLRALCEQLGYRDVRTLLNSGNIVFTTSSATRGNHATRIEKALVEQLGLAARVTVLSAAELAIVIAENPIVANATNHSRFLISFLNDPADARKLAPLVARDWGTEALAVGSRAAYLWCADGILESPLATAMGKALGDGVTSRNWSTVLKLAALTSKP